MNPTNKIAIPTSVAVSKPRRWTGRIIESLLVIFLLFDGITKVIETTPVIEASKQLGLPMESVPTIGIVLIVCAVLYAIPKTSIIGAILLTGYLGGATATHVRAGNPAFPIVFSLAFGVLVWVALVLREPDLFKLIMVREWPPREIRGN